MPAYDTFLRIPPLETVAREKKEAPSKAIENRSLTLTPYS